MKILNFGSLNVDYVSSVDYFVRAGETLKVNSREVLPGGKGLNQSVALARAGEDGREALGKALLQAGDALFGREAMDGFCRAGMAADSLTALVEQTLALILGGEETDGDLLTDEGVTEKSRADAAKK